MVQGKRNMNHEAKPQMRRRAGEAAEWKQGIPKWKANTETSGTHKDMLQDTLSTRLLSDAKGCVTGRSHSNRFEYQKLSAFSQTCSHVFGGNLTNFDSRHRDTPQRPQYIACRSFAGPLNPRASLKYLEAGCKSPTPRKP